MKIISAVFCFAFVLLLSCQLEKRRSARFDDLINNEEVFIGLADYGLDSVPPDIVKLKNAKRLFIWPDSLNRRGIYWALPLNEIDTVFPPYHRLPDTFTKLVNLETLMLHDLNLSYQKILKHFKISIACL